MVHGIEQAECIPRRLVAEPAMAWPAPGHLQQSRDHALVCCREHVVIGSNKVDGAEAQGLVFGALLGWAGLEKYFPLWRPPQERGHRSVVVRPELPRPHLRGNLL
eukprot:scaffold13879_cov61-Phaeocystis_antarctica.AAC.7